MCLAALGSCLCTACAGCCCSAFKDCKAKYGPGSRIPYMFIMFIFSVFAICMVLFGEKILWSNDLLDVEFSVCNGRESCQGNGAVYRTSFTLFLFFAIHAFIVYCVLSFHYLFFIIKLFCIVVVLTITFFIPGAFFEDGYVNFARIGSGIFLLIQIYVLIGWAYDTNERINLQIIKYENEEQDGDNDKDEDELKGNKTLLCLYKLLIIGGTLIFYILTIIFWVFQFEWFVYEGKEYENEKCSFNQAMLAILIILVIILSILPPVLQTGSIFTTSIVSFYMSYLVYSALESSPNVECNWFANSSNQSSISLWLGCIITAAAISYTGFSVSKNQVNMTDGSSSLELKDMSNKKKRRKNTDDDEDLGSSNYDDATDTNIGSDDGMDPQSQAYISEKKSNVTFHICMAFAAIYMCMLYTGWGDASTSQETGKARGWTSVTVNLVCVLITTFLYGWTIVAPKVCPGRFEQSDDDDDQINMDI